MDVAYGSGSVKGTVGIDNVNFGGLVATGVKFGLMTTIEGQSFV